MHQILCLRTIFQMFVSPPDPTSSILQHQSYLLHCNEQRKFRFRLEENTNNQVQPSENYCFLTHLNLDMAGHSLPFHPVGLHRHHKSLAEWPIDCHIGTYSPSTLFEEWEIWGRIAVVLVHPTYNDGDTEQCETNTLTACRALILVAFSSLLSRLTTWHWSLQW